jgi:hypothetical protein
MTRKNIFTNLTILLYLIVILHILALFFSWYWSIWWYDIVVHTLGGVWVGGIALWLYFIYKDIYTNKNISKLMIIAVSLLVTLLIGVLWEVFEFSLDTFIVFQPNDLVDTASDIGSDIVGSLLVSFYFIQKIKNNITQE